MQRRKAAGGGFVPSQEGTPAFANQGGSKKKQAICAPTALDVKEGFGQGLRKTKFTKETEGITRVEGGRVGLNRNLGKEKNRVCLERGKPGNRARILEWEKGRKKKLPGLELRGEKNEERNEKRKKKKKSKRTSLIYISLRGEEGSGQEALKKTKKKRRKIRDARKNQKKKPMCDRGFHLPTQKTKKSTTLRDQKKTTTG